MHTLVGFYDSIANGTSYGVLAAAVDPVMSLMNGNVYLANQKLRALGALVIGADLTGAQIDAPSLRTLALPEVYPGIAAAAVPDRYALSWWGTNGPVIQQNETFGLRVSAGGAAPADKFGLMWLAPQFQPAQSGPITTIPFTATITAVKGQWVTGALTPATILAVGKYQVVGAELVASNALAGRLAFPGVNNQFRPGVVANSAYGRVGQDQQNRYGRSGSFGEFQSTAIPSLEIFGLAAGAAAPVLYLDLIKTG
jgi:hypothetical protein